MIFDAECMRLFFEALGIPVPERIASGAAMCRAQDRVKANAWNVDSALDRAAYEVVYGYTVEVVQ